MAQSIDVDDEEDLKKKVDEEYHLLKRKLKISELYKIQYPARIESVLEKQKRVIKILEEEKDDLATNISVSKSKAYRGLEDCQLTEVYNSIEEEKKLDEQVSNEKSQIVDLKKEIDKVKKDIISYNKTDIHESKITEKIRKSNRYVDDLERKLLVSTQNFNNLVTENMALRTEIENLLNDRRIFYKNYMHLYQQLMNGKQIMLDLIEQATTTCNQKEDAQRKLNSLKDKAAVEKRIQSKDVQELKRKVDNLEDLYAFLSVKGQKRNTGAELEEKEARERKKRLEEMQSKLGKYLSVVKNIRNLTDVQNIEQFVSTFKKGEAENLGLLNLVNDINDEVQVLQNQVTITLQNIDEQKELNSHRGDQQQRTIEELEETVNKKRLAFDDAERRLIESQVSLQDLLMNIEKMFQGYECELHPIIALLGNNAHVNKYNVELCLALIENQIYELIYIAFAKEKTLGIADVGNKPIIQDDIHFYASKRPMLYHLCGLSPCPLCVETDRIFILDENNADDVLENYTDMHNQLLTKLTADPKSESSVMHNISTCRLPRSRAIMQARFQEQEHDAQEG